MKIFFPIILIVVAIGLFFFKINPLYSEVRQLRVEAGQYDEALQTAEELKEIRTELATKLDSFPKADLEKLDHFLPNRLDTVRIILDVNGIGARNGVRLEGMTVSDTSPKTGNGAPGTTYGTIGITFSFTATYPQGILFIEDMQKSLRLFDTTSLTVRPSAKTGVSDVFYDYKMGLQTYWIDR